MDSFSERPPAAPHFLKSTIISTTRKDGAGKGKMEQSLSSVPSRLASHYSLVHQSFLLKLSLCPVRRGDWKQVRCVSALSESIGIDLCHGTAALLKFDQTH